MDHVDLGMLLGRALGEGLRPTAQAHLERCRRCRMLKDEVDGLVAFMRDDHSLDPPAAAVRRAVALLPVAGAAPPGLVQRIVETLGRLLPAVHSGPLATALVRGAEGTPLLRFEGQGVDVRCQLAPGRRGRRLVGQIIDAGVAPPPLVRIEARGRPARHAPVSEHGLFALDDVPAPPFDLLLAVPEGRLRLAVEREVPTPVHGAGRPDGGGR